ncbi:FAD-dependent oxidoreductase [Thiotrichales bacterium 19X7-9]|nr:FAD-dependent oxidoreductase [Thiotrichales bacterium 19X7-9]
MLNLNKVAIFGAGLMGRVLALTLLKDNPHLSIDLYDKDTIDGKKSCGYQAAGMLAPMAELMTCHGQIYAYGKDAQSLWSKLLDATMAQYKDKILQTKGTVIIAAKQDHTELDHIKELISFRIDQFDEDHFDINKCYLSDKALKAIMPSLDTTNLYKHSLYFKDEAVIDVPLFYRYSYEILTRYQKVQWFEQIEININDFNCSNQIDYDYLFDCRGLGAKDDLNQLFAVRGEAVVIYQPQIEIDHVIRLLHPRHSLYLIPRGKGIFYVGATSINADDLSNISVESLMELLSMLYVIDVRFSEARVLKTISHLRPTSENDLPIIEHKNNMIRLNGLSRHGYLFAPKVALEVLNLVKTKEVCDVYTDSI